MSPVRQKDVANDPILFRVEAQPIDRKNGRPFGPEMDLWQDGMVAIGTDEAGRGPLAGPVVAAAVCFPPSVNLPGIGDSKVLTEAKREKLFDKIQKAALGFSIIAIEPERIDETNILAASAEAMGKAVREVAQQVDSDWPTLLVDGRIPSLGLGRQLNIIKGDARSFTIGAASILAKVHRDRLMVKMAQLYPEYGFERHKGYPTEEHRSTLLHVGRCPIHRCSFTIAGSDGGRIAVGDLPKRKADGNIQ